MLARYLLQLIEFKLSSLVVLSMIILRGLKPEDIAIGAELILEILRKRTYVPNSVLLISS